MMKYLTTTTGIILIAMSISCSIQQLPQNDFKVEFEGDTYGEAMFLKPGDLKIINVDSKRVYVQRIRKIEKDSIIYASGIDKIRNLDNMPDSARGYLILSDWYVNKMP